MNRRIWGWLVAIQATLVAFYLLKPTATAPFSYETLDEPAPESTTAIVHFWATWCAPCQTELPSLLQAAREEGVVLIAYTEEPSATLETYFHGDIPPEVRVDDTGLQGAYRVSGLPDTFRIEKGRIQSRVGGPRDWSSKEARAWLRGESP